MASLDMEDIKRRMEGAVSNLIGEFSGLRAGRASVAMLDPIIVDAYGSKMPLSQLSNISVPDSRLLSVSVWDGSIVTSVEKANVMMSGVLWREVMTNLHKKEGSDILINHMYADNCAMQLVRDPKQFDVIVTDNLFGDILSDCAAMLTGSLGMLPSASLGSVDQNTGKRHAMYEPVHGSAPDIAGKELANPLAELLSLSMLFRYSFEMKEEADLIDEAVSRALDAGPRTQDIMASGRVKVGTKGMMDTVINKLEELTK